MSAERRPDRVAPSALAAALAATGARGGRLVGPTSSGRPGLLAADGEQHEDTLRIGVDLLGREGSLGRLEVWGAPEEEDAEAALRLVAAVCARAMEALSMERERADDRTRARRLGAAATAVREPSDPREAVARVLAEARMLLAAPAALLIAAGAPTPEVAAYDGIPALSPEELALLAPPARRADLADGHPWRGPIAAGHPVRAHGLGNVAIVGMGPRAGLGVLMVLGHGDEPVSAADLGALSELAGHAASALTMSVLQQEVRDLGTVDPTTRFYNARYFRSRLDQECERALRAGVPLSVAIVSLDGLAEMRAEGRAAAAEAAVEALSRHVAERLRTMDVGCRVGQDELAAILPEVEGLDALRVGERMRASLATVPELDGLFTLSVGIASFPSQAGRAESLEENARTALDWARAHGGDRTFLFHAETAAILRATERERVADDEAVLTTVAALAASIDARHPSTVFHSENVGRVAALMAAEFGLPLDRVEDVRVAGLLHDVGKIGVSDDIVVATEELSEAQREELRRHPEIGERMLAGSRLTSIAPWVLHHHERFDGTGYPAGLRGEEIPLEARILAVANAFDRLISGSPGLFPTPVPQAIADLERRSGSEFDPVAVAALRALVARGEAGITPRF
jgi:diguanylate cyclase (GGDEF)-like protein